MKFSSVVSYHTNPHGCGVANFSKQLAERLGVPFVGIDGKWGEHPLLSLKWSEIVYKEVVLMHMPLWSKYSVFWHDSGHDGISANASHVFYADPSLGSPGLWCPSLLKPSRPRTVRLFSFGMAGRLQTAHYAKVRRDLSEVELDYQLRVSVGLHEGTSLSDATKHFEALREIMGPDKVSILGILSDDAVADELQNADYVLSFFDKGLRANNTTVHAAVEYLKIVISNHDADTPEFMARMTRNVESNWLDSRWNYGWDELLRQMRIYANTANRQPAHQR